MTPGVPVCHSIVVGIECGGTGGPSVHTNHRERRQTDISKQALIKQAPIMLEKLKQVWRPKAAVLSGQLEKIVVCV
jgi:hypothetical protein